MRGIATIDRQPDSDNIAIWVTSRTDMQAGHTNAVTIDLTADPRAMDKVRSLTRCSAVLLTEGSTADGLPIDGEPLTSADVEALVTEIEAQRVAITDAVQEYKRRSRSKTLTEPEFQSLPSPDSFHPKDDTAKSRAFALANLLQKLWTEWLRTDEERKRRTVQPRTGKTPWVMPEHLNAPTVPDFPAKFAERVHEQPLV